MTALYVRRLRMLASNLSMKMVVARESAYGSPLARASFVFLATAARPSSRFSPTVQRQQNKHFRIRESEAQQSKRAEECKGVRPLVRKGDLVLCNSNFKSRSQTPGAFGDPGNPESCKRVKTRKGS